ncbi:hypothetical protein BGZ63DRAFT_383703 [Mariannaea sp. PMI_226]|nr:hypothetical protein BGZ63DRAFT_383703 [Mariannaea sp. PMI_226]
MNELPLELVEEILHHLPSSSCPSARLTSRTFNAILSRRTFHVLASFIENPEAAKQTLTATARDPAHRTRAIWSPHCLVPEGLPITESFLLALWTSLHGVSWTPPSDLVYDVGDDYNYDEVGDSSLERRRLTVSTLQLYLEKEVNVTEEALRDAMFRYALYLSYVARDKKAAPHAWVFDFLLHKDTKVATTKVCDAMKQISVMHWEGRV